MAFSAGTNPIQSVNPHTVAVMQEKGIDISRHVTKALNDVIRPLDLIVTLCNEAANSPLLPPYTPVEHWPQSDPARTEGTADEVREAFRKCRDQIEWRVGQLLSRL